MKKLNLSGKDIRRIGITDDKVISLAKNIMQKHYKHQNKAEALEILKKVMNNPEKFHKHPQLGKIAQRLTVNKTQSTQEFMLKETKPYKIYGRENIEESALQQMETAMRLPIAIKGALMPDAHQGYGLPIGGVIAAKNAVIPFAVGMDIGCRMAMSIFPIDPNFVINNVPRLKNILLSNTSFGKEEHKEMKDHLIMERQEFNEIKFLRTLQKKAYDQLGTSGHGNHFVDIGILEVKEPTTPIQISPGIYLAVLTHSGSRGTGAEIARHYTKIASQKCSLPKGAKSLAWLELGKAEGEEYWKAMNWAGDYSAANHEIIHKKIAKAMQAESLARIENHHNFAWKEKLSDGEEIVIHRKGATPAHKGTLGIIPGSMVSPAFIVRGKGNEEALNSAAHGAGRLLSRSEAKRRFTKKELHEYLNKNNVTLIGGNKDESPFAYKDINEVMRLQQDMVDILAVFKPKIVRMA
ncbi:MAG: RtcB family protein [Bacteroidales bacterium]